jgi:hypothetical protein
MWVRERLKPPGTCGSLRIAAICLALLPGAARAAITITAPALTVPYSASAQSGTFEVWVQSNASPQPQVGAFNIENRLPPFSSITFSGSSTPTMANTTPTAHPYVFSGQAPAEKVVSSGRTVQGSDNAPSSVPTLSDGAGLLLVTYTVPPGATGFYPLTFVAYSPPQDVVGTVLFDQSNNTIPTSVQNGSITIIPPTAYWRGTTDGVWTTDNIQTGVTNWTIDAAGTTDTHIAPAASTDVFFVGAGAANLTTTLGANLSIKGLTFTSTATSPVTIGGSALTIGADGLTVQTGSAGHTINSAVSFTGSQTWHIANDGASPLTVGGALTLPASASLTKADGGTLVISSAPSLGSNSSLAVNGGTMKFSLTSGSATVGTGVTATVAAGATLELAGSVSALSSPVAPTRRVNVINNSTAGELVVSGTNQQVGAITGTGKTTVASGGSLTANSILQSAIIIGGSSGNPARLTIAASDSTGNSLAAEDGSGFSLGKLSAAATSAGSRLVGVDAGLLAVPGAIGLATGSSAGYALPAEDLGSNLNGVPEPSTALGAAIALVFWPLTFGLHRSMKIRRKRRTE